MRPEGGRKEETEKDVHAGKDISCSFGSSTKTISSPLNTKNLFMWEEDALIQFSTSPSVLSSQPVNSNQAINSPGLSVKPLCCLPANPHSPFSKYSQPTTSQKISRYIQGRRRISFPLRVFHSHFFALFPFPSGFFCPPPPSPSPLCLLPPSPLLPKTSGISNRKEGERALSLGERKEKREENEVKDVRGWVTTEQGEQRWKKMVLLVQRNFKRKDY